MQFLGQMAFLVIDIMASLVIAVIGLIIIAIELIIMAPKEMMKYIQRKIKYEDF